MPLLGSRCQQYSIHAPRVAVLPRKVVLPQHKVAISSRGSCWDAQKFLSCTIAARRVACSAQSGAMNADIEFVHPPREGKLESTALPDKVRNQVGFLLSIN